jgi:transposase
MATIAQAGVERSVLGGVDTHKEVHVAAVIDDLGRILATAEFAATRNGVPASVRLVGELR